MIAPPPILTTDSKTEDYPLHAIVAQAFSDVLDRGQADGIFDMQSHNANDLYEYFLILVADVFLVAVQNAEEMKNNG